MTCWPKSPIDLVECLVCWMRDIPPHSNYHDQRCSNRMEAGGLGVWVRIGYIIHELTTEVHDALSKKDILKVEFEWIWYMFRGFGSSPGFWGWHQHHTGKMVKPSHCKNKYHISTSLRRRTYLFIQSVYGHIRSCSSSPWVYSIKNFIHTWSGAQDTWIFFFLQVHNSMVHGIISNCQRLNPHTILHVKWNYETLNSGAHSSKSDEVVTTFLHNLLNRNLCCIQWYKSHVHSW